MRKIKGQQIENNGEKEIKDQADVIRKITCMRTWKIVYKHINVRIYLNVKYNGHSVSEVNKF